MSKQRDRQKVLAEFGQILRTGRVEIVARPGKTKDDPWRVRLKGLAGADYAITESHPLDYHLRIAEEQFKADLAKLCRDAELPSRQRLAVEARTKAAEENKRRVLELAEDPTYAVKGSGMAGAIAVAVGFSQSQVRRILAAAKKNAHD
ncbi:MAG: hypothetical protein ACKOXU_02425 [Limnohabitans sp.]